MHDVNLLLNGKQKAAMAHGKGTEFVTKLAKGDYTMKFVKTDDTSVSGETTFTVDGETSVSVNIRTETDYVNVTKNDPSSETNKSDGNGNEGKKNEPKIIGINEEFGNKTITAVVTEVNLDFKDYSDYMVKVPEDSKMILVVIIHYSGRKRNVAVTLFLSTQNPNQWKRIRDPLI